MGFSHGWRTAVRLPINHSSFPHQPLLEAALANESVARFSARLSARLPEPVSRFPGSKLAAVAAILRVRDDAELLFIKRAEWKLDPWSGHIAFPGGRQETNDASLEMTAVRETREEIDIDLTQGALLGQLDDLAPRSPRLPAIIIRPFVAVVAADVTINTSDEVADAFWIPLSWLRNPASHTEYVATGPEGVLRFPAYDVNGHILWGLTERIVSQMLPLFDP